MYRRTAFIYRSYTAEEGSFFTICGLPQDRVLFGCTSSLFPLTIWYFLPTAPCWLATSGSGYFIDANVPICGTKKRHRSDYSCRVVLFDYYPFKPYNKPRLYSEVWRHRLMLSACRVLVTLAWNCQISNGKGLRANVGLFLYGDNPLLLIGLFLGLFCYWFCYFYCSWFYALLLLS